MSARAKEFQEMLKVALKYDMLYGDLKNVKIDLRTSPIGPSYVHYNWSKPPKRPFYLRASFTRWMSLMYVAVYSIMFLLWPVTWQLINLVIFLVGLLIVLNLTFIDPRIKKKENVFTLVMPSISILHLISPFEKSLLHELQHIRQEVKGLPISEKDANIMANKLFPIFRNKIRRTGEAE